MKRVIITVISILVVLCASWYLVFYSGMYLPLPAGEPEALFVTEGENILRRQEDGTWQEFQVRGVNLDNFIPGCLPSDHDIPEETWMRWFAWISDMGANTIRCNTIYNDVFYNALYAFNEGNETPLYLLQGIQVTEYANNNRSDAYQGDFYRVLLRDGEMAVDVIHGRRMISANTTKGDGFYRRDVSPWVIGFLVGSEWSEGTIAYTNNNSNPALYEGKWLKTAEDANAFETMLCRVMDHMISYESEKYETLRLISFYNDPLYDPFVYDEGFDLLYGKYVTLDINHILPENDSYRGLFASYSAYPLCDNFAVALSETTKARLGRPTALYRTGAYLHGYLDLLQIWHDCPILISAFERSTSRGVVQETPPMNETTQGIQLAENYEQIMAAGCSGAFIESWQDSWVRRSYNTTFAVDYDNGKNWLDPLTAAQSKGILAFVPENPYGNVVIDGDFSDFEKAPQLLETDAYRVKYSYDAAYLYFYIDAGEDMRDKETWLTFDVTPKSGSLTYDRAGLVFDTPVDFILEIDGEEHTGLLVQERYDVLRANYLEVLTREDPYVYPPEKDADVFVRTGMLQQSARMLKNDTDIDEELEQIRYMRFDTGKLHYGNGDPDAADFDSLADFCFGENGVEIRLAWTMLNFSDPSARLVHDDYYAHYGRENIRTEQILAGIGDAAHTEISHSPLLLTEWEDNFAYTERLKASYGILKQAWEGKMP